MSPAISAIQASESFFAAIPHRVTADLLEPYGIDATPLQCEQLTRDLLVVNLFWIQSALAVALPPKDGARVMVALQDCLHRHWQNTLGLNGQDWSSFWDALNERRHDYERIVREGGSPMAVLIDAATHLASAAELGEESRSKLLAFLLDTVPVDALGELAAELELTS